MFQWMFQWFKSKSQVAKDLARAHEIIGIQDDVVASLELALADANRRADAHYQAGRQTCSAMLLASGCEMFISPDILEVIKTTNYEIKLDDKEGGGIVLSLTTSEVPPPNNDEGEAPA